MRVERPFHPAKEFAFLHAGRIRRYADPRGQVDHSDPVHPCSNDAAAKGGGTKMHLFVVLRIGANFILFQLRHLAETFAECSNLV